MVDFVFQGFQPGLPLWIYPLLAVATAGLAWWSYKDITGIRPLYRYTLITLRSLAFLVLLIVLVNPLFRSETLSYERPETLVMFDNSASTAISKGNYEGDEEYRRVIRELNFPAIDRLSFRYFSFGDLVNPSHPDSLTFNASQTNLSEALEVIRNNQRDARAALLFTDGIFNRGPNPVYLARELNLPLFTVALGDTARLQDLVVQRVVTNTTGYLNTPHRVEVSILNEGFEGEAITVELLSNRELLQSRQVVPSSSSSTQTLSFELIPDREGLQQYEIRIPPRQEEWSENNNTQPFSIEVLDDRQNILSIAFEIHPDVGLVRSLLASDRNSQLSIRTWVGGNRFIGGSLAQVDPDSVDLVILHGYPKQGVPGSVSEPIGRLLQEAPALLFPTPDSWLDNLPQAESLLPISNPGNEAMMPVSLAPMAEPTEHPVMELPEVAYDRLPTVFGAIQGLRVNPGSTILFNNLFEASPTGQPLIAVQEVGNLRRTQINAYGWYRIAQSRNPQARAFIEALIFNAVGWTATQPDNRRLKLQPTQTVFTGNEPVSFTAFLTNESGEVESDGVITLEISGDEIEPRIYNMENASDGRYELEIGALPVGIYRYNATAEKGSRQIDTATGEFSVSGSNLEFVDTNRNDALLGEMASISGGQYYSYRNAGTLWQDMDAMGLLEREERVSTDLFYPYRHASWFILAIVLLGLEWFLRKYVALP